MVQNTLARVVLLTKKRDHIQLTLFARNGDAVPLKAAIRENALPKLVLLQNS